MQRKTIDMSLAPDIDVIHAWFDLDESIAQALSPQPQILERIENSIDFTRRISADEANRFLGALVRSAATELVSIEDVQHRLRRAGSLQTPALYMNDSSHPLLCVTRELRNVNIHLASSTLASHKRDLLWGRVEKPEDAMPITMDIFWIDNIDLQAFSTLQRFDQTYDRTQFSLALDWFDSAQREWGIPELLLRAARIYASELATFHS